MVDFKWGIFVLVSSQHLDGFIVHCLDVASVSFDVYPATELEQVALGKSSGHQLDFTPGLPNDVYTFLYRLVSEIPKADFLSSIAGLISFLWSLNQSADLLICLPQIIVVIIVIITEL